MFAARDRALVLELSTINEVRDQPWDEAFDSVFSWPTCLNCHNTGNCATLECCWTERDTLQPYLQYFKDTLSSSQPDDLFELRPSIRSRSDIFAVIRAIRTGKNRPKVDLMRDHFRAYDELPSMTEQYRAFDLGMALISMIKCSAKPVPALRIGAFPEGSRWKDPQTASDFVAATIPFMTPGPIFHAHEAPIEVSAFALESEGLELQCTDDLSRHLLYHPDTRVVEIFQHVPFLKECLKSRRPECPVTATIMPRRLLEETLYTMEVVLCPWDDQKSRDLLERMGFKGCGDFFDTDLVESYFDINNLGYCGQRMRILADVLRIEKPRLVRWSCLQNPHDVGLVKMVVVVLTFIVTMIFGVRGWNRN